MAKQTEKQHTNNSWHEECVEKPFHSHNIWPSKNDTTNEIFFIPAVVRFVIVIPLLVGESLLKLQFMAGKKASQV